MGSDLARKIRDNEIIVRKEKGTNMKMIINYNGQEKISDSYTGCSTYLDTSRNTENKNAAPVNTSGVIRVTNNWNEIKEMRKQEEQKVEKAVETVHAKSTSAKVNFDKAKSLSNTILGTKVKNDHKEEEKAEEVKIPITNQTMDADTFEKPFTAQYTIGTIAGVKIDDIKGEEPKDVEKKDFGMSQEPVRESSLFGGVDSMMYQQEPYNSAKMSRQERRKNNKSKKEKKEKKRSYTTNVHSSPVPRKGLNNMQYNMEEENEQEEVKQEKHNPVINNKLTHF